MATGWMEQKKRKLRAQRSKAPRWYKSGGVDHNAVAAHDLFNNRSRVATTFGPKNNQLPRLTNSFTQPIPQTFSLNAKNTEAYYDEERKCWVPKGWVPSERSKTFETWKLTREEELQQERGVWLKKQLLRVWQGSLRHQGTVVYHRGIIREGESYSLVLYFHGTEFIFEQVSGNVRWLSMTYRSAETAREALVSRVINWVEMETFQR